MGKDQTGLIEMLVLMILGVPLRAIEHDYQLSTPGISSGKDASRIDEWLKRHGLPKEFGRTAPEMAAQLAGHFDGRHGGLEAYLDNAGFDSSKRDKLRDLLLSSTY